MVFVGVGSGGPGEPGLHHPDFLPSEETVGEVARAMLNAARRVIIVRVSKRAGERTRQSR